jgi:creatinine amidohydrolase
MRRVTLAFSLGVIVAFTPLHAQQPDPVKGQKKGDVVRGPHPVDVLNMARPIEMHDSVWIQELTTLEVRDLLKEGKKTTALILGGGMEENGPYLVLDKHNIASRAMGESIARKLGNALCAPILAIEPGNPDHPTPGAVVMSAATYRAMVTDMAASLQAMGFKTIVFLGDHGGDMKPMSDAAETLNEKWKGTGAKAIFIEKYGNNVPDEGCCGHPGEDVVGVHEKIEGLHDSYMMTAMMMTLDLNSVRLPERIKAGKTTTNAIDLLPVEKTIADGKKLIDFRAEETANEIRKRAAAGAGSQ